MSFAGFTVMPFILFGGLMANNNSLAGWLSWVQYISPIKYGAEAQLWNEFSEDPYEIRDKFLEFVDYKMGYWNCIGIFIAFIIGARILAFFFFKLLVERF